MATLDGTITRLRFAKFFLDLRTRELCNDDQKISLQEQPFQILVALLERPGELVTREELRARLWPSDTFVDFDQSLNKAVNRLREALTDAAEHPRFIETLPRRGYRWIAPVLEPDSRAAPNDIVSEPRSAANDPARWSLAPKQWTAVGLTLLLVATLTWMIIKREASVEAPPPIHSLAVLPLESLSADSSQAYFADGMTDQLITTLGQINELRVISRTSTTRYKATRKPLPEIGRELNVDAIIEGTVLRSGNQVRITAQLIQTSSERHLWAESYQGDLRDILTLQNQVADDIATKIRKKLVRADRVGERPKRTVNPKAYEAFLSGFSQPFTTDGTQKRLRYFERAAHMQPDYAEAYAQIGYCYLRLGHILALPPQKAFPEVQAMASKVLELDPLLPDGHVLAGNAKYLYEWNFADAEQEMRRAIDLNPNYPYARMSYAAFLASMGRQAESIAEIAKWEEIDPLDLLGETAMAAMLYSDSRFDEAIAESRKVLTQDPNFYEAHLWLGLALEQKRDFPSAIDELKKAVELSNETMWIGFVAHAKALSGDRAGALKILNDLQRLSQRTYVSPWWFAVIYSGLGDKDDVFIWLEKAYQAREHDLPASNTWPIFNFLHSDQRYQDFIHRIGLPPPRRL